MKRCGFVLDERDVIGLIRPAADVHTMGLNNIASLLSKCGFRAIVAGDNISAALNKLEHFDNLGLFLWWLNRYPITRLGLSYRMDENRACLLFDQLYYHLCDRGMLAGNGGHIRSLYFAGLPHACRRISRKYGAAVTVFRGHESGYETLRMMGVPEGLIIKSADAGCEYDRMRATFGKKVIDREEYQTVKPFDRSGYPEFGTAGDNVVARIRHARSKGELPLFRAHAGPYDSDRSRALATFLKWVGNLAKTGYMDVLSIGTSLLSQSCFGQNWREMPNGGGVPVNSEAEYCAIRQMAKPVLVRTYAGTSDIPRLARIYERSLDMAWHALSFWWFCLIDGRGPNTVLQNLEQHLDTLAFIARRGKPFEPNIPHHFTFRGADDVTAVVSGYLAAKTARLSGVKTLILQIMLNNPRKIDGIQDLARARAILRLVKSLEGPDFKVIIQPRGGLDHFSPNLYEARIQLAAVTALMDDIEPFDRDSPQIVHVVSYCEAAHLATPVEIDESIRITQAALMEYRAMKAEHRTGTMDYEKEIENRVSSLVFRARLMVKAIECHVPDTYTSGGLYKALAAGFLAVPDLMSCREEFRNAVAWKTGMVNGEMQVIDDYGRPVDMKHRIDTAVSCLKEVAV